MASMHRLGTALRAPGRRSLSSTTRDVPRKLSSSAARVFAGEVDFMLSVLDAE